MIKTIKPSTSASNGRPQVLVVCSDLNGRDYQRPENMDMLNKLAPGFEPTFLNGETKDQEFPDYLIGKGNLTKFYDIVLFAGCNRLDWLFTTTNTSLGLEQLIRVLKDTGKVIFVEGNNYKNSRGTRENGKLLGNGLTMEIKSIDVTPGYETLRQNIINEWYKFFK